MDDRIRRRGHLTLIPGGKRCPQELLAELRADPAGFSDEAFAERLAELARFLTVFERVQLVKRRRELLAGAERPRNGSAQ